MWTVKAGSKSRETTRRIVKWVRNLWLLVAILLVAPAVARAAEPIRIAIGPFFAPPTDPALRSAAQVLPDLLLVELSNDPRFVVLERAKVQHVVEELDLTSAALTSGENVAKVGHLLSCDWLISGTLVRVESGTRLWTKIISVRDGVVRD